MSFCVRDLSVLAYANGFTLWHYRAPTDALQAVERPGYFDAAQDVLSDGDMLLVNAQGGTRMLCVAAVEDRLQVMGLG